MEDLAQQVLPPGIGFEWTEIAYQQEQKGTPTALVIALIAAALGFGGIAGASAGIAQILFYVFLVLLLISLVMHFVRGTAR